jgi:hypothetical protein
VDEDFLYDKAPGTDVFLINQILKPTNCSSLHIFSAIHKNSYICLPFPTWLFTNKIYIQYVPVNAFLKGANTKQKAHSNLREGKSI